MQTYYIILYTVLVLCTVLIWNKFCHGLAHGFTNIHVGFGITIVVTIGGSTLGKWMRIYRGNIANKVGILSRIPIDCHHGLEDSSIVAVVFVIVYAFTVHWMIGMIFVLVIPVMAGTMMLLSKRIKKSQDAIVSQSASLAGVTTETIRNISLIKML